MEAFDNALIPIAETTRYCETKDKEIENPCTIQYEIELPLKFVYQGTTKNKCDELLICVFMDWIQFKYSGTS